MWDHYNEIDNLLESTNLTEIEGRLIWRLSPLLELIDWSKPHDLSRGSPPIS